MSSSDLGGSGQSQSDSRYVLKVAKRSPNRLDMGSEQEIKDNSNILNKYKDGASTTRWKKLQLGGEKGKE